MHERLSRLASPPRLLRRQARTARLTDGYPALLAIARKDRQAGGLHRISAKKVSVRPPCALCLCGGIVSCMVIIIR
jgi:hypothetical protein